MDGGRDFNYLDTNTDHLLSPSLDLSNKQTTNMDISESMTLGS